MARSLKSLVGIFVAGLLCATFAVVVFGTVVVAKTNIIASTPQSIDLSHYGKL